MFWMFMPWLPHHISLGKLNKYCSFSNDTEMFRSYLAAGEFAENGPPTAKLELTLESFDLDCLLVGWFTLVSEKMRCAMALGPTDVQYFEVDASQSAPLPQSKRYQIMHIPHRCQGEQKIAHHRSLPGHLPDAPIESPDQPG